MELHVKLDQIRADHLEELLRSQQQQLKLLTRLVETTGRTE
jgi:hypothetical protein